MPDVASVVSATPRLHRPALIAVDGFDGSGKTTFSKELVRAYSEIGRMVHVVHLDDFLNPRELRWRRGRASPEGFFLDTYDLEAFTTKVLEPLADGGNRNIVVRHFDYRSDRTVAVRPVKVEPGAVVIVEGMFLHRDELAKYWDVSVFLDVPFSVSARRLAARDGSNPDPNHPSLARYVDGQRLYLATCLPRQRATILIDNS